MKKYLYLFLLAPLALTIASGAAQAQRKNTTAHDVPVKAAASADEKMSCDGCTCGCQKQRNKQMMKKHHQAKQMKEKTSQN